jgi:hypothetical protein
MFEIVHVFVERHLPVLVLHGYERCSHVENLYVRPRSLGLTGATRGLALSSAVCVDFLGHRDEEP